MARNETLNLSSDSWTQITNADVTEISFHNTSSYVVHIMATAGETAPTGGPDGYALSPGDNRRLMDLAGFFPGVSGANRVWAYVQYFDAPLFVSHA